MENNKVLITSCGGLTGTYLTKLLSNDYSVFGVDISDNIALKDKLTRFIRVPKSDSNEYIPKIKQIIFDENIKYLIPVSAYDINVFSKYSDDEQLKNKMLIVDYQTNDNFHNKENCYYMLETLGINAPKVYKKTTIEFPAILKPKKSSGSKNVIIVENEDDLNYWMNKFPDSLLCEYLDGDEWTVDCLFRKDGTNVGFNIRKRDKVAGGGAVISTNDYKYYDLVRQTIKIFENYKKIIGPINFQFKVHNNELYVFDFNTRFASGGLPLTIKTGFNIPKLLLDLINDKIVSSWDCKKDGNILKMIRYYNEAFI